MGLIEVIERMESHETNRLSFYGEGGGIVHKSFAEVQAEVSRLQPLRPTAFEMVAE